MALHRSRVFVYGTLRRGFPLHHHLTDQSPKFIDNGTIRARLYDLGEYPGARLSDLASDEVDGEVYELLPEQLRALDEIEEYDPKKPADSLFVRKLVDVSLDSGDVTRAWVYVLPHEPRFKERIVSGNYADSRKHR